MKEPSLSSDIIPASVLEAQLLRVIERPDATISFAGPKKRQRVRRSRVMVRVPISGADDHVRQLDGDLLTRAFRRPLLVPIRYAAHTPSVHRISLQTLAAKHAYVLREPEAATLREWVAPFHVPPTIEDMAHATHDLRVTHVDPRWFVEQFAPGLQSDTVIIRETWWSRMRSPFVRWEMRYTRWTVPSVPFVPSSWRTRWSRAWQHIWRGTGNLIEVPKTVSNSSSSIPDAAPSVFVPKIDMVRVMTGFMGLCLLVSIPAGAVSLSRALGSSVQEVKEQSFAAVEDVKTALGQGIASGGAWRTAANQFEDARRSLGRVNGLAVSLASALPSTRETYDSIEALLEAGERASKAAEIVTQAIKQAFSEPVRYPDERLLTLIRGLDGAAPILDQAFVAMRRVYPDRLPPDIRDRVERIQSALSSGQSSIQELRSIAHLLVGAVGHEQARRYLVIFQNQTELRPTGGFMGSLAEVTLDRGEIKRLFVPGGGPYDLRSQLLARVSPPDPLRLVGSRWEFQDANWFPDFPESAQKIRWFWSKGGQSTVDGVIAVNATFVQKLLGVTGPIDMPEYGKTITADNFLLETQKTVELEYDKSENKPKKFIGDLMPKLIERLKSSKEADWFEVFGLAAEALRTKEIQVAFVNEDEQALADALGWSGRMGPVVGDGLAVIEANIAGQKTDGVIDEQVEHEAVIQMDGSIVDTVTLTRTHHGVRGELFRGANNVAYVRLYVPEGSELLTAEGFVPPDPGFIEATTTAESPDPDVQRLTVDEGRHASGADIQREFGRTVFGGWTQLSPGKTTQLRFTYRLPFTVFDLAEKIHGAQGSDDERRGVYLLSLTSQSGTPRRTIKTRVSAPPDWRQMWTYGTSTEANAVFDRDRVQAFLFEPSSHAKKNVP